MLGAIQRAAQRMTDRGELGMARRGQPPSTFWQLAPPVAPNPITPDRATEKSPYLKEIPSRATDRNGDGATGTEGPIDRDELRRRMTEGWDR
jgi:hypothetical protein